MKKDYKKQLEAERDKLNRLVDEALENGTPLSETQTIMKQSRKVDHLIQKSTSHQQ